MQWYQQAIRCSKICFIESFKLDLHVSGDSFAHPQEHFDCLYSFLEQFTDSAVCCWPVTKIGWNPICLLSTGATDWMEFHPICVTGQQQTAELVYCSKKLYIHSKCSWRWAKLSPETCRAVLKDSIKQSLLHLVGGWYHHQCRFSKFH